MAPDRRVDLAAGGDAPVHERQVLALHRARGELAHESGLRLRRLGDDQQTRGVIVETMDDAGTRDAGERGSMVDERVSERAVEVPGARMNDQARRFVDHDDRVVLVHDR